MDFTEWNHIEIMVYIFQNTDEERNKIIELVTKRLKKDKENAKL